MSAEQPKKKWYKSWWIRIPAIIIAAIIVVMQFVPSGPIDTCEALSPKIIDLSEDQTSPFKRTILKLYDITTENNGEMQVLNCSAMAKFNRGDNSKISFYVQKDADGDRFYGFKPY